MSRNKRSIGSEAEDIASVYLSSVGYNVLERNFHCRTGEIDIIAKHMDYIVFIEVKYRKNNKYGYPGEAVNLRKQNTIINVAKYYMLINNLYDENIRFDVVEILNNDINIIENAFS